MFRSEMTARISKASEFFRKTPGGYVSPFDERGFEVGDGWLYLILMLAKGIHRAPDTGYRCEQVKQKLGRLEVYFTGPNMTSPTALRISTLIAEAQGYAAAICELCKAPGRLVDTNGYHWVACPTHSSARLFGKLEPIVPHTWEMEEVDGGPAGIGFFHKCHACGASGGPVGKPSCKGMTLYPPFLSGDSVENLSLDCNIAKQQIKELTRV